MTYDKQDKLMHYIFDSRYNDMKETFINKKTQNKARAMFTKQKYYILFILLIIPLIIYLIFKFWLKHNKCLCLLFRY